MADVTSNINIKIEAQIEASKTAASLGELKKSMRELESLALQAGDANKEAFQKATIAAGQTKDKIKDLKEATGSLSGSNVDNLSKSFQGLKSNLLSLDIQGAKAQFQNMTTALGGLVTQITGPVIAAFSTLKGALIATGIGAAVIAIASLVAIFYELGNAAERAAEQEKEALELRQKYTNVELEGNIKAAERNEKLEISRAEAAGKGEKVIFDIRQRYIQQRINVYRKAYSEMNSDDKDWISVQTKIKDLEADLEINKNNKIIASRKEVKKIKVSESEEEIKRLEGIKLNADYRNDPAILAETNKNQIILDNKTITNKKLIDSDTITKGILKANSENSIRDTEAEKDARLNMMDAIGSGLEGLSELVGKNTAVGKGLAVASTLINTYASIVNQLRASTSSPGAAIPGWAIAQAIATGIFGLVQVKKILSTKVPGGSGGGSADTSSPSSSLGSSPSINQFGPSQLSNFGRTQLGVQMGEAVQRVYVVESDITRTQNRVRVSQSRSILGR